MNASASYRTAGPLCRTVVTALQWSISTEGEGVGYGTHQMGHARCHRSSIGCECFMSKIFNE